MIDENRLEIIDKELADALVRVPEEKLRMITGEVVGFVIKRSKLDNSLVAEALTSLGSKPEANILKSVEKLVNDLDKKQWDLKSKVEMGRVEKDEYLSAFRQARAANALLYALESNPLIAARESIYEAFTALGEDKSELRNKIQKLLVNYGN